MSLFLFSGFLGSGKTTMVVQIAKYFVEEKQAKVMLIVNDVGDVGIDAQLMRKMHTDVHELFGGCVCGQLGNLITLLKGIGTKYAVDTVIVEASGIAQPARFIDTIEIFVPGNMGVKVISLADASRWQELTEVLPDLINGQIGSANLVVINKIDAVSTEEIVDVENYIKNLRPDVEILKASANNSQDMKNLAEVMYND